MSIPNDRRYLKTHEWVRLEGDSAIVGITDFAQHEMGDIVFVELPEVGQSYDQGGQLAVVESVKAVSDIYAPVGGEVISVNGELEQSPELLNASPYDTQICAIQCDDAAQYEALMDGAAYEAFLAEENA